MHPQRQGFTLIEMLLVIVILGIIGVFGFPRMSAAMTNTNVRGARTTLINLIAKARTAATQTNRIALLKINGDHAFVLLRPRRLSGLGDADTLGTVVRLGDTYGVTVIATIDSVRFDPRGMGTGFGTGTTFLVSRNGHSDTITIDGLGRVTK
jgi:prepilin-type N-terminal cleavage/methylation domain-containing protein